MRVRPVRGGRIINVRDRLGRALLRAGAYVAADDSAEEPQPTPAKKDPPKTVKRKPKPAKKGPKYNRRDMRAED